MMKSRTTNRTKAKALHRVLDFTMGQDTIVLDFTMGQDTILYKARNFADISSSPPHFGIWVRQKHYNPSFSLHLFGLWRMPPFPGTVIFQWVLLDLPQNCSLPYLLGGTSCDQLHLGWWVFAGCFLFSVGGTTTTWQSNKIIAAMPPWHI